MRHKMHVATPNAEKSSDEQVVLLVDCMSLPNLQVTCTGARTYSLLLLPLITHSSGSLREQFECM